ncbi:hypothetical protein [Hyphomonas sp.]|uniref:hypothetical protein n=1 Tax=Hyphomonas sp. TaxID=87 RepID=UPI000C647EF6|nr:hypothetical protein [Hyphomonas sp.]MAU68509.1 hypothetical protein [Hyphomonas sp.]MBM58465.1 hypothetical protein [Hyphomonas sp.]
MHPDLQRYFNHVWPLFWPWLVWNLVRVARWHARTGREALMAVDCFGNIRLVCLADATPPDDLYTYEVPRVAAWNHPALGSDVPVCVRDGLSKSGIVRHDPAKSGLVICSHDIVRYDHGLHVRGPP